MVIDMKKLLAIIMAAILIFSMTACQSSGQISCPAADEPEKVNAPGSNGASKPTSTEPPELKILDSTCLGIVANKGTYSWMSDNGDGTQTGKVTEVANTPDQPLTQFRTGFLSMPPV